MTATHEKKKSAHTAPSSSKMSVTKKKKKKSRGTHRLEEYAFSEAEVSA